MNRFDELQTAIETLWTTRRRPLGVRETPETRAATIETCTRMGLRCRVGGCGHLYALNAEDSLTLERLEMELDVARDEMLARGYARMGRLLGDVFGGVAA